MVFSFDHLETPGHVRMDDYEYDLNYYRDYMIDWLINYGNNCWMSIFYNNHDNPRMVNKITEDKTYHEAIMKLLAVLQLTLKGTPFIFQGDEMGLVNYPFTSMEQVTDVEAKGYYAQYLETMSEKEAFAKILTGTREHTRVLLPWNEKLPKYHEGLVQNIRENITAVYKELIGLRHHDQTFVYGEFHVLNRKKDRFVYERSLNGITYLIDCNLGKDRKKAYETTGYECVFTTGSATGQLEAYEARIWKKQS